MTRQITHNIRKVQQGGSRQHGKGKGVQTAEPHVGAHVLDAGYLCVIEPFDYHGQPARYESARRLHCRDEGQQVN